MIIIKTEQQIEGIRKASQMAASVLTYLTPFIKDGNHTEFLNTLAHKYIIDMGAIPAPLNYFGYPKSICTSINEVVCHGIPSKKQILKNGDIVNIDITVKYQGFYGDCSRTFLIGQVKDEVRQFVHIAEECMTKGIEMLKPGMLLSQMGRFIDDYAREHGYSVVREYGGHGIGLDFHEDPHVCHFYTKENDIILKKGMIFTVEPMVNMGKNWRVITSKKDGWTVTTADNSLSAQFEHTVLITENAHEILTIDPQSANT